MIYQVFSGESVYSIFSIYYTRYLNTNIRPTYIANSMTNMAHSSIIHQI
jgi:hypothetical protein